MSDDPRPAMLQRPVALIAGPAAAFVLFLLAPSAAPQERLMLAVAAVALWMSIWWVLEAVPLAVTALLPFVMFPLLGVMNSEDSASHYFNSTVFLFIGGFIMAIALERWQLHRRIALTVLGFCGSTPRLLLLGLMASTAFISMWMSNTAVALLMLPVALAVLGRIESDGQRQPGLAAALCLAVAYSASIGGIGTPLGSPPNLVFLRLYSQNFPELEQPGFGSWMLVCVPLMLLMLLAAWAVLCLMYLRSPVVGQGSRAALREELHSLGPVSREQWLVGGLFCLSALLWLTRLPLNLGSLSIPGWSELLPHGGLADDGTVAILASLALFLMPAGKAVGGGPLLRWEDMQRLPWGMVLLFGGGFALAAGVLESGLSAWAGERLALLGGLPLPLLIIAVYLLTSLLGELASNTAVAQIVLPIAAAVALASGVHPMLLMLPVALAASLDFILPSATPPNAIALASGRLSIQQLVRTGIIVELLCALLASAAMLLLATRL